MQDRYWQTTFGKIHARTDGRGEPILLLHGRDPKFNSWRTWEKNIQALAAAGLAPFAFDLIGYGESDVPETPLNVVDHENALIQVLDAEGAERAHVIGLSWGGRIAQLIALDHPGRVDRLVLVDSLYEPNKPKELSDIVAPTLITWDRTDVIIPVQSADVLHAVIPGSQSVIFDDAQRDPDANPENRHWTQQTHSNAWNRVVTEFLGSQKGTRTQL